MLNTKINQSIKRETAATVFIFTEKVTEWQHSDSQPQTSLILIRKALFKVFI